MRAITFVLLLLSPLLPAFEYDGDETLRREAALTVQALLAHGFPEPDAVRVEADALALTIDGETVRGPLAPRGGTLVEPLIGITLGHWGPTVPEPLAAAARAHLSSRTRGSEWTPRTLSEALVQAFVLELIKDDPERLGELWEAAGRGEPWAGMDRFFAFRYGLSPEAFFARCAFRSLPHLLPFLSNLPSVAVRDGETAFELPAAPPLTASALDVRFPSGPDLGLRLAWDSGLLPSPSFLLVSYGPPLDHFDLIDLGARENGITLPLSGVARLTLLSTSPAFALPSPAAALRAEPAEGYPCRLEGLDLSVEEEGASVSFTTRSMTDVAAFVVLRGTEARPGRLETVGFLPGLETVGDPFSFTLVDPERPPADERPAYHLYAITADGLMAFQKSFDPGGR